MSSGSLDIFHAYSGVMHGQTLFVSASFELIRMKFSTFMKYSESAYRGYKNAREAMSVLVQAMKAL